MYQRDPADRIPNGIVDHQEAEFYKQMYSRQNRGAWLKAFGASLIVTVLLLVPAVFALYWTTHALVKEVEASTRAWLVPTAARLVSNVEKGKPIDIGLQYRNVGKVPASDVNISYTLSVFPNEALENGTAMASLAGKDICRNVEPVTGSESVYPGPVGAGLILAVTPADPKTGKPIALYETYTSGNHTIAVQFCIAYRTLGVTHKSAFCYFHRPDTATGLNLNQCSLGNRAN